MFMWDFVIFNVYVFMGVGERMEFWIEFFLNFLRNCRWVFCGDWNVVERRFDKFNECRIIMMMVEKLVFKELIVVLNVVDWFLFSNLICFLGDNKRRDGVCILVRLDCIYIF